MKKGLLFLLLSALVFVSLLAQGAGTYYDDTDQYLGNEITIQRNIDFQTAVKIIERLSLAEAKKNIVNLSSYNGRIPFPINNTPWRDALKLITTTLGLVIEEKPGAIIISDVPTPVTAIVKNSVDEYNIYDKMVRIHATFLQLDRDFSNEAGINWNTLFRGQVNANVGVAGGMRPDSDGRFPIGMTNVDNVGEPRTWPLGSNAKTTVSLEALLTFIESSNKGQILARPTITVNNGKPGYIQLGEDFSVRQLDESGNTVDKFYSTGVILNVSPVIIEEDGFEAIYLHAAVENSEVTSTDPITGIRIKRNQSTGDYLLFDGEETVLGGLINTKNELQKAGIPVLKNLPWWAFGFLFGYTREITRSTEMVVILKVEIVPAAMERVKEKENIRDTYDGLKNDFDTIKEELLSVKKTSEAESDTE